MQEDIFYMNKALSLARKAYDMGEVPVGALIVKDNQIISQGYNLRESTQNPLTHAELIAIEKASKNEGFWRLVDCTLYVTLEPCAMCTGAVINSRIKRVVFGAFDKKAGCIGSICDLTKMPFNHIPQVTGGVMKDECSEILSVFFKKLRDSKNQPNIKGGYL